MPLIIGLTGTIAAGKSTVGQIMVEQGAVHCDADKLVHGLYAPGTPGFYRVVEAFGEDVVGADGFVDRKILGSKVFGKPEEMNKLTRAMGSIPDALKAQVDQWRAELGEHDVAVFEIINLMEPGYARWCDLTWIVGVDEGIAKQRLMETRGLTEAESEQRLKSMAPLDFRIPGADWVYMNNGGREELAAAVTAERERITREHKAGTLAPSKFVPWWREYLEKNRERLEKAGVKVDDLLAETAPGK